MNILEMQARRAEINESMQMLAKLEAEGEELTVEQIEQVSSLQTEFNGLSEKLCRAEAAEKMQAATATQVVELKASAEFLTAPIAAQPAQPKVKGAGLARMATALVAANGNVHEAAKIAADRGYGDEVSMALTISSASGGGVLVPEVFSTEVIELLQPKSVVRGMGAVSLPLNNGNMTLPRLKSGAVAGYIGTDDDIPTTEQTFEDLKLSAKKLAAMVPISNDLIAYSGVNPNVDRIVVNDLTTSIGLREDLAFIRGDGTAGTPKGLLHWALGSSKITAGTGATIQDVETDLSKMLLCLQNANSYFISVGWLMSPRTMTYLESMRDGNGNKVYPELAQGTLKGYPFRTTTQIPDNLGGGGNESEIYLVDFSDCFIGEAATLKIDISKEATYKDSGGNVISAFQRDQTLVRVITQHDFGPRHQENIVVLSEVKWGA